MLQGHGRGIQETRPEEQRHEALPELTKIAADRLLNARDLAAVLEAHKIADLALHIARELSRSMLK
jgi:hypothetical protein